MLNDACGPKTRVLCWASLAAVAGSIWPLRASLAASDRLPESLEGPKSIDEAARASPTSDFLQFWVDHGLDFQRFSWFFEVPSRRQFDRLRTGPHLRFCWQAQYFRGFAGSTKTCNIVETRGSIAPTTLPERAAREKLDVFHLQCDSASIFVASARSRMLSGAPFRARGDLGDPLGAAGAFRGRLKTLPRRSWDGLGAFLGANGVPSWLHLA